MTIDILLKTKLKSDIVVIWIVHSENYILVVWTTIQSKIELKEVCPFRGGV